MMLSTSIQIAHKSSINYISLKVMFCCIFSQTPIGIENWFDLCSCVIRLFLPPPLTVFWWLFLFKIKDIPDLYRQQY